MSLPLEEYAVIGDTETAALVGADGSIDWLCLPRFDADACFAALLGEPEHGHWSVAPDEPVRSVRRRYRPGTLILETEFVTRSGTVRVTDGMPPREAAEIRGHVPDLVRIVEGLDGTVPMRVELVIRFGTGADLPWITRHGERIQAIAGPDALDLRTSAEMEVEDGAITSRFAVGADDQVPFVLTWHPSHEPPPDAVVADRAIEAASSWWRRWTDRCTYRGPYQEAVEGSLAVLKALTYAPTGGIVAAPTTSLPEKLGGVRNWDYRYVWLRDATFTLYALMTSGHAEEAAAWRDWLLRAVAGDPASTRIMYGIAGERHLPERELPWLPGYEGSTPVRVGNAAAEQIQLDVYGEVMDAMHFARRLGVEPDPDAWQVQGALLDHLEDHWQEPDHGLWEIRTAPRHYTHSHLMAWVAFDRAVKAVEEQGLEGPVDRWRQVRERVRARILERSCDPARGLFVQHEDSTELDASLLMMPLVGFLPADDPRMRRTIEAIDRELSDGCLVHRYRAREDVDGLPPGEGAFLLCSFWMVDCLTLLGRVEEARERFEALLELRNDVGLLGEMYDADLGRTVGNYPQAFSHVGLINSAWNLSQVAGAAHDRGEDEEP